MKPVAVDTSCRYRGMETIILENNCLKAVILPELGAKMLHLVHKPSDTEMLWLNPSLTPHALPCGSSYDDNFFGGWDELFPNDEPVKIDGKKYPDHGELWCRPWEYIIEERTDTHATVYLWCFGSVSATRIDKWITVTADRPVLKFRHKVTNLGDKPLDFLWKLHPALAISPDHRIDLPQCTMLRGDEEFSDLVGEEKFSWSTCKGKHGGTVDLRKVPPPESCSKEFLYGTDLADGWCAMTDTARKVGFGLVFPKDIFTSVWLFSSYGGWRGNYVAILEPCTAYPFDLQEAISNGTCAHLDGHSELECEIEAVLYEGLTSVSGIELGGKVTGE